jgi:hypothetical protein
MHGVKFATQSDAGKPPFAFCIWSGHECRTMNLLGIRLLPLVFTIEHFLCAPAAQGSP